MNIKKKYAQDKPSGSAVPAHSEWKHSIYTCPELGQTCLRPGAYDAFKLPSLMQGVLIYPREINLEIPPKNPTPNAFTIGYGGTPIKLSSTARKKPGLAISPRGGATPILRPTESAARRLTPEV